MTETVLKHFIKPQTRRCTGQRMPEKEGFPNNMWNYNYIIPSYLLLVVFLTYYLARPRLPVRMNTTFLYLLAVESLVMLFDILSSRADENFTEFSTGLLYTLNMVYFVLFLLRVYIYFRLTLDVMHMGGKLSMAEKLWNTLVFIVSEAVTLSSFLTGAVFSITKDGYQRGPLYNILYVCFFFYILLSVYLLIVHREQLSRFEYISALSVHLVLFIGNIVRILLPNYLIMNAFCILAIIIIYLSFENPDLYMEYRGGSFNTRGFRSTLNEIVGERPFRILAFALRNYNDARGIYGGTQMDKGIGMISHYLARKYPARTVYYLRNGCFAILGNENMDWDRMREGLTERFQEPWQASQVQLDLSVSFVQIGSDAQMDSADRLINDLYIALEKAGSLAGISSGLIDLDSVREIDRQVDIRRWLEKALEQEAVEIYLQPLTAGKDPRPVCAEALARIRNDEGELVLPGKFIPIAEQTGRIILLGEQVFEKTCEFIRDHDLDELGISWINVNLSPIQCMRRDLGERFSILEKYGVDAGKIHLEITEESMVDLTLLLNQIEILRKRGFFFVLDDYGSGYSNLTRVKRCPFINIKLDMELVWDYFRDRDVLCRGSSRRSSR